MEFGVAKIENYDDRFDTSGNTSESSNRTPSIESWDYSNGTYKSNHS